MSDKANYYEPDNNDICRFYKDQQPCSKCWYQPIQPSENMSAKDYIGYIRQTKGMAGRCFGGTVGLLFACTSIDLGTRKNTP